MNSDLNLGDPFANLPTVTLVMVAAAAANLKHHDARDRDAHGDHDAKAKPDVSNERVVRLP